MGFGRWLNPKICSSSAKRKNDSLQNSELCLSFLLWLALCTRSDQLSCAAAVDLNFTVLGRLKCYMG